ncbi:MAG: hypothetical protein KGO51_13335, partial [Alphaproteobacteria bacterium]|nr:hypothetical protein [Alphaproteobacteria bacterium]
AAFAEAAFAPGRRRSLRKPAGTSCVKPGQLFRVAGFKFVTIPATPFGLRCFGSMSMEPGAMREPRSFAYSLSQYEEGWAWSVYDENGVTVARGADESRDAAQAAVNRLVYRPEPLRAEGAAA